MSCHFTLQGVDLVDKVERNRRESKEEKHDVWRYESSTGAMIDVTYRLQLD